MPSVRWWTDLDGAGPDARRVERQVLRLIKILRMLASDRGRL
jgi:hypothetical protein